jgi:hypothetical protein
MHANPSATVRYSTPSGGRCGSGRVNRGSRTRPCNAHRAVRATPRCAACQLPPRRCGGIRTRSRVDEEAGVFRWHVVGAGEYCQQRCGSDEGCNMCVYRQMEPRERSSGVIGGHQGSSEVIRGHRRSSRETEVTRAKAWHAQRHVRCPLSKQLVGWRSAAHLERPCCAP